MRGGSEYLTQDCLSYSEEEEVAAKGSRVGSQAAVSKDLCSRLLPLCSYENQ
jgi:hypothetical protein